MNFRHWDSLASSFLILSVAFEFTLFSWPAFNRPRRKAHGWSFADADAGGAIELLAIGILSQLVGKSADLLRPRIVILSGIALCAGALVLLAAIQSRAAYVAYCAMLGVAASAVSIVPVA